MSRCTSPSHATQTINYTNILPNSIQTPCIIMSLANSLLDITYPKSPAADNTATVQTSELPHYTTNPKIPKIL